MGLLICTTNHKIDGLKPVESLAPVVEQVAANFADDKRISGIMTLSTCNRVEVILDINAIHNDPNYSLIKHELITELAEAGNISPQQFRTFTDTAAIKYLFDTACGLNSAVIGEREIAGQLRRSLIAARQAKHISYLLGHTVEAALQASRKVAKLTKISANGRSLANVGLQLVENLIPSWHKATVLLIGTGSYAGTSVAALTERGVAEIEVFSNSGRAAVFAKTHPVSICRNLESSLAKTDLVLSCSGSQPVTLNEDRVNAALKKRTTPLVVLDLSISGDTTTGVAAIPEVELYRLNDVIAAVPEADLNAVAQANKIVKQGIQELTAELDSRRIAPAIVAMRNLVAEQVAIELKSLPAEGDIPVDEVAKRLRQMAARIIHLPSTRARQAAENGQENNFINALTEVFGISVELAEPMINTSKIIEFDDKQYLTGDFNLDDLKQDKAG